MVAVLRNGTEFLNLELYNFEKVAISVRLKNYWTDGTLSFEMLSDSFRYIRRFSIRRVKER